ncbi:MAG: hypothetical protein H7A46_09795 [Verrucomicrobiales bacterium]|nr:hypothetical protein [Verrucomicrobiales bacterium]
MKLTPENRQRLLLIVAAAAVGVLTLDRLVLGPYLQAWRDRADRIATLQMQVTRGEALLDRAEALNGRWERMQSDALPVERSAAEEKVLQAAASWAREARVNFTSLTPQWRQADAGSEFFECRAALSGSLSELSRFIYALERDPVAVRVEEIQIASDDDRGRDLNLNVRFSGLTLIPPTKKAPATP